MTTEKDNPSCLAMSHRLIVYEVYGDAWHGDVSSRAGTRERVWRGETLGAPLSHCFKWRLSLVIKYGICIILTVI